MKRLIIWLVCRVTKHNWTPWFLRDDRTEVRVCERCGKEEFRSAFHWKRGLR